MTRTMGPGEGHDHGQLWSMGAVSQATGIGEHTLRAWERRFGFPSPLRLPSGHRRYTTADVTRLRMIAQALRRGHRAGEIVPMAPDDLRDLLGGPADPASEVAAWLTTTLQIVRDRHRAELFRALQHELTSLGAVAAVEERIVPLLEEVGRAWASGTLSVGHEHFVSQVVEDVLRKTRLALEPGLSGAPVILATLPGDLHLLGLQAVALQLALAGRSLHILGPDSPEEEIVAAARELCSPAVTLSISVTAAIEETRLRVGELRARLPAEVRLLLGGAGSLSLGRLPAGAEVVASLADLARLLDALPERV